MKGLKLNAGWKNFIMALVGVIVSWLAVPETANFVYILISSAAFVGMYAVKNALLPSISVVGYEVRDFISGAIVAVCGALSSLAATLLTPDVVFEWSILWTTVIGAVIGYFAKTGISDASKK